MDGGGSFATLIFFPILYAIYELSLFTAGAILGALVAGLICHYSKRAKE